KGGLIFRTACEGVEEEAFAQDLAFLQTMWSDIQKRGLIATAPKLVNEDFDLTLRSVRDLMQNDIDRIVVDDDAELARIQEFIDRYMPGFEVQLERWDSDEPMLARYGVEWEITRAVRRKVWLKSGGYILIDRTEALMSIDVNTGRYVGKSNFEDTIVDINVEAVKEIAYQLRLRDIGGIIVIDFIDMDDPVNQRRVVDALTAALAQDRARSKVLPMSGIGLVEMTRKRVRNSIVQELTEPCFYCEGKGYLKSMQMIAESLILNLHQQLLGTDARRVDVRAHPYITELLVEDYQEEITKVEQLYGAVLELTDEREFHVEHFSVRVLSASAGIQEIADT
ncbi:MAG: ribonuclease G, partial [Myxococcota bacterium]